jgi:hypothetical protein
MMGQSNMLGEGDRTGAGNSLETAVKNGSYPYLWDKATGNYSVSKTVRNVFVMASGGINSQFATTLFNNEFMTAGWSTPNALPGFEPKNRGSIGPELGIGFTLGNYTTEPVMALKSCIGDRALGWDLLPPGTPEQTYVVAPFGLVLVLVDARTHTHTHTHTRTHTHTHTHAHTHTHTIQV